MAEPSKDPLLQYHAFIGWLLTEFAHLEFHLRRLLLQHSGLTPEAFETLIGFPRTADATSKLQKLLKQQPMDGPALAAVDDAFAQLKHISTLRDWIVHYGGNPVEGDKFLVRLKPTQTSEATGENYHLFTRPELWTAVEDAQLIVSILLNHLDKALPPDFYQGAFNGVRREPWRYIPPRLVPNPRDGRG